MNATITLLITNSKIQPMHQTKFTTSRNPFLGFLLLFLTGSLYAGSFSGNPATLHFDLNECTSYFSDQSNQDYSEFTATASNTNQIELSVVGNHLYRMMPSANTHSCTPGVNGTEGMCVSFDTGCNYNPESSRAVKFDVNLTPLTSQSVSLTGLDFYEKSPLEFDWIDGASGPNNYPLFYGVRIIRDGLTIYEQSGFTTNLDWTLQSFDFSGDDNFTVSDATVFNFELLAYCPVGIPSGQNVWDLDEITVTADCSDDCNAEGGTLTGGPFEFCVGDGVADNLAPGSIVLSGNSGINSQWVITDDQGNILGLPPMPSAVDFDGAGAGTCLVWHLSFEDGLTGAAVGNNAMTDLDGCYNLSNPISVVRNQPLGGTLAGGPFEFCVGDGVADNILDSQIVLTGNSGTNSQWVVTDDQGNILGLPPTISAVNFDGAGAGTCLIWHLSFEDGLTGAVMGNNAMTELDGCYNLSNPISVTRNQPAGGTLTGGPFSFTVGDGIADNILPGSITLTGNSGTNSQWVVTDDQGNILGLPPMPSAVDFEGAGVGTCLIWHLSFEDGLTGAAMGNNALTDLVGCYSLSNNIAVVRTEITAVSGGTLSGGPFEFCVGDGVADNLAPGSITLTGNSGTNSQWVVTDDQGNILGLPPMPSAVDFDGAGAGTCLIWNLSFENGLTGAVVGNNALTDLVGTYSLSNSISVTRNQPVGGVLAGGPFSFIVGDGVADNIAPGSITLTGNSGTNSQWVVTDDQGNILGLPPMPSAVDFEGAGAGT